jgi:hypothetical protein
MLFALTKFSGSNIDLFSTLGFPTLAMGDFVNDPRRLNGRRPGWNEGLDYTPVVGAEVDAAIERFVEERGLPALQQAISGGQHDHPEGLFYGGRNPTWSHTTVRHVLREHGTRCQRLGWIDLHTGLGPRGVGERIFACRDDDAALKRAKAWWGDKITSLYDGSSTSASLTGMMWMAAYDECPQAEYTSIALEYGTLPITEMMDALRADQWLELHPEAPPEQARAIKQHTRDAFYPDTDTWKQQIIDQALDAANGAVRGLAVA